MSRFASVNNAPNARPASNAWADPILDAYANRARIEAAADQQTAQVFLHGLDQIGGVVQDYSQASLRRIQADEQARREIWAEREQYNYKTQQELAHLRDGLAQVDAQPWNENVKAQVKGQIFQRMYGLKDDQNNFAPKAPSIEEMIQNGTWKKSDDGSRVIGVDQNGKPFSLQYNSTAGKASTSSKELTQAQVLAFRKQAVAELDPTGENPPTEQEIAAKQLQLIENSNPDTLRKTVESNKATDQEKPNDPITDPVMGLSVLRTFREQEMRGKALTKQKLDAISEALNATSRLESMSPDVANLISWGRSKVPGFTPTSAPSTGSATMPDAQKAIDGITERVKAGRATPEDIATLQRLASGG